MVKFLTRPQFRRSSPPTPRCAAGKSCVRFPCADWVARLNYSMETKLAESSSETIREEVRRRYGATARGDKSSCGDGCCTSTSTDTLGYSAEESAMAPGAANLGLACGNHLAIASPRAGQVVIDLGSGGGVAWFL